MSLDGWGWGVLAAAVACPGAAAGTLAVLAALFGGLGLLRRLSRWRGWTASAALAACAAGAIVLRDRHNLVGDARLWLDWSRSYGLAMPVYNEFLGTRLFGLIGELVNGRDALRFAFALVSVACGLLVTLGVARLLAPGRDGAGSPGAPATPLAALLVFLGPMSFVFYGHIETYPLFLVALVVFLGTLAAWWSDRAPAGRVGLAFLLLAGCHTLSLVLLAPLTAIELRRRGYAISVVVSAGALVLLLGAAIVIAVPELRAFTLFAGRLGHHLSGAYLSGLLTGWLWLLLTPALLLLAHRRRLRPAGTFEHFLLLAGLGYLLLPLGVTLTLGAYSDLDILSPAFLAATLYAARRCDLAAHPLTRRTVLSLIPGVVLLAAWLTTGRCPAGIELFEAQARIGSATSAGQVYELEIAADGRRGRGDPAGARDLLVQALAANPGSLRLHGPIGELELVLGDTAAALHHWEELRRAPRSGPYLARFAQSLIERGDSRRAADILAPHLEDVARDAGQSAALAVAWLRLGHADSSLMATEARTRYAPEDAVAWYNRGAALVRLNRAFEAREALHRSLALDPANASAHLALAGLLLALDGPEALEAHLRTIPAEMAKRVRERLGGRGSR